MADYGLADSGGQRDRITQALMDVQAPPPVAQAPQAQAMAGGPQTPSPMPGQMPPPMSGGMTAAAAGTPGVPPTAMSMPQLGSAVPPGMQPGGMLAPQPPPGGAQPMTPPRAY